MDVILADSWGMCFGVRDAIQLALDLPQPADVTVLGELVHNPEVLRRLRSAGIRSADSLDSPVETGRVMITAHGASAAAVSALRERGLRVEDATCPLVRHAHRTLARLVEEGYFPVVIGRYDHVEVRGLVGDLETYAVISGPDDVGGLAGHPRLGVVCQTTQPPDFVRATVERIRLTYPDAQVRFVDTVCQPTRERQSAARRLAARCPVVIVVGGRGSNNTRQLVRACEAEGARAYQVENAGDLREAWFQGVSRVGLTAGTSTPDDVVESVRQEILKRGIAN